jgi:single-stranded-DNA-specific exonuclease
MRHRAWRYTAACDIDSINLPEWSLPGGPLPPELLAILIARGFKDSHSAASFLLPEYYTPSLPTELPNMDKAVRILQKMRAGNRIMVWGDFDVDGQTSTAIAVQALASLDIQVDFYIPDRQTESHGVNLMKLSEIIGRNPPDVLLVCDTGSSDHESVMYAKSLGKDLKVIIADHHELKLPYPRADALVNPQMLRQPDHPFWTLSGAGVVYQLIEALFHAKGRSAEVEQFLDLVAIGLIADVVEQVQDTRYLIQRGLRVLNHTERIGLHALTSQLNLDLSTITATDIAFKLAPTLNAFGRLESARTGVELLTTQDISRAQVLAMTADGLNQKRKMITKQTLAAIHDMIQADPSLLNWEALVVSNPKWHLGIIGVVAGHLAEYYNRPAVVMVEGEDGIARASVRSVEGYPVHAALSQLADTLITYGGHVGAGGFSVAEKHWPALRRQLSQAFGQTRTTTETSTLAIEGILSLERLSLDFALELQRLSPFGAGNPEPVFVTPNLTITNMTHIGRDDEHRRLIVLDENGFAQPVFWWDSAEIDPPQGLVNLAYKMAVSTYQGERQLQLELVDWEMVETPEIAVRSPIEVFDYRSHPDYDQALEEIFSRDPQAIIWADGFPTSSQMGLFFSDLHPADALVILSTPPDNDYLRKALEKVNPRRVYLLAVNPPTDTLTEFLKLLRGLAEKVIHETDGAINIQRFMERLGQTKTVVQLGLEFIAAHGKLTVDFGERTRVVLSYGDTYPADEATMKSIENRLRSAWEEVEAYRRYVQRAEAFQLIRG